MFKKIFVVVLSLSMSSIIASQKTQQNSRFDFGNFDFNKIEDLHAYIQNIESLLVEDCKDRASVTKEIIDETKSLEVYCFCREAGPLLITATLSNKETRFTEVRIEKNTNGNDINTTETYYTYYDSKSLKSSTKISSYRNDKKDLKYKITEILREEYEDAITNAKIMKKIKIKPKDNYDDIEERYFEYYTDADKTIAATIAKELVVVIKGTVKIGDTLYEYDRAGLTTSETKIEYVNGLPSKKTVTNYDGTSNKVVMGVIIYEYNEAGLEKFKTVEKYKNGKLISSKYFELIYNSEGKLEKEKPAKKK